MRDLGDVWDYVHLALNKSQKSGGISPSRFTTALNAANLELAVEARSFYEETSALSDDARALVKTIGDSINPTPLQANISGVIDFPEDYQYFSSLNWLKTISGADCEKPVRKRIPVEWLTDNQWSVRYNSRLKGPTERHPICTLQNNKLLVAPIKSRYELTYWKKPVELFFDYVIYEGAVTYLPPTGTHDGTNPDPGIVSGDSSRSVEAEWTELKRFADKVLRILSGNKRADQVYREALIEMQKQEKQWSNKSL